MSAALIERPETTNQPTTIEPAGIVHHQEHTPTAMSCPVCGSGSTYQTMDGRWGCIQCGSTWA